MLKIGSVKNTLLLKIIEIIKVLLTWNLQSDIFDVKITTVNYRQGATLMRYKSPERANAILQYINTFFKSHGRTPSLGEIANKIKVSKTTIYKYLLEMNEKGQLSYKDGVISTETTKITIDKENVPVVGSVPCGPLSTQEELIEEYLPLPKSMLGNGEHYILRAEHDSMVDAGISPGDLVVIERTSEFDVGDIIVALDGDNQNTLKAYGGCKNGKYILEYMNEAEYPGKVIEVDNLSVQGVAKTVIKKLSRKRKIYN